MKDFTPGGSHSDGLFFGIRVGLREKKKCVSEMRLFGYVDRIKVTVPLFTSKTRLRTRAVRNCSFRFDTNNSVWQAFIPKPITISIMGKLDFETNTENEIAI